MELVHQVETAVDLICSNSKHRDGVFVVGALVFTDLGLYNCALVIHKGELVSIVPKTMIPNYGEYYEGRYFDSLDVGKDVQNGIIVGLDVIRAF